MLLRMYTRWRSNTAIRSEWLEESGGEEAGIKSATVRILGLNAYGWLKTESGVHRLVRISPLRLERAPSHQLLLGVDLSGGR